MAGVALAAALGACGVGERAPLPTDPVERLDLLSKGVDATPTQACLWAMRDLDDLPLSAPSADERATIEATLTACQSAGEYIKALRVFPGAWAYTDSSKVAGTNALTTIRSACGVAPSSPVCVDADEHELL